jgi:hypothetical protein
VAPNASSAIMLIRPMAISDCDGVMGMIILFRVGLILGNRLKIKTDHKTKRGAYGNQIILG